MPRGSSFVLLLLLAGAARADDDRAAQVLARVQQAAHAPASPRFRSRRVLRAHLERKRVPEAGGRLYLPVLPEGEPRSERDGLDVGQARKLARELFAIYGYRLGTDPLVDWAVPLDGLDAQAKVGFRVLPPPSDDPRDAIESWFRRSMLPNLRREGYRVLLLPADRFRAATGDDSTPLLAAALSIVSFLDRVTRGADADLDALAGRHRVELAVSGFDPGTVATTSPPVVSEDAWSFALASPATVTLDVAGSVKARAHGRPSLVVLPFAWTPPAAGDGSLDDEGPRPSFLLLQPDVPPLRSGRALFLTDPGFDPGRPFRIRLSIPPGRVRLGRTVTTQQP